MANQKLRVVMHHSGRGEVFIDGEKLSCVQSIDIRAAYDEATTAIIKIVPDEIEFEGDAEIMVSSDG